MSTQMLTLVDTSALVSLGAETFLRHLCGDAGGLTGFTFEDVVRAVIAANDESSPQRHGSMGVVDLVQEGVAELRDNGVFILLPGCLNESAMEINQGSE